MRVFVTPQESLDRAVEILRSATPLTFRGGGMVGAEAVLLVDPPDLETALFALQRAGIKAEADSRSSD
jgi:hypothetical protein